VIYPSDHGLAVGQHGLLGKQNCYDHSIRIPLILRGPGLAAGSICDDPVYGFDLFPTLCELSGIAIPSSVQGRSFASGHSDRSSIYSVYMDAMASVKDQRYKLIRSYRRANGAGSDRIQLFDLETDPWELHDHSAEPGLRPRLETLAAELERWQRDLGDPLATQPALAAAPARGG
jgi:arylsulfatase A-like enzyme